MRTEYDQVGVPIRSDIDDFGFRIAILKGCGYGQTFLPQYLSSPLYQGFRLIQVGLLN
jgi:hypothetical protein